MNEDHAVRLSMGVMLLMIYAVFSGAFAPGLVESGLSLAESLAVIAAGMVAFPFVAYLLGYLVDATVEWSG